MNTNGLKLQDETGVQEHPNGQAREDLRRNSPLGGPRCFREVAGVQKLQNGEHPEFSAGLAESMA
jgi:hypothetical protein